MNVLWQGARGPTVEVLQKKLQSLGFDHSDQIGLFGPSTKKAVLAFQKVKKLPADGLAGPKTLAALKLATSAAGQSLSVKRVPKVFISYSHADGKWIKRLQVFLAHLEREGLIDRWGRHQNPTRSRLARRDRKSPPSRGGCRVVGESGFYRFRLHRSE